MVLKEFSWIPLLVTSRFLIIGGQLDPPVGDITFLHQRGQLDPPVGDVTFSERQRREARG